METGKIESWKEIPSFKDIQAESEYWMNHGLSARLMANSKHDINAKESTTITLRFDPRMLSRIKRMARARYLNYQSMMKQWLSERLEDETRRSMHDNDSN